MSERGISEMDVFATLYFGRHVKGDTGAMVANRRLSETEVMRVVYTGAAKARVVKTVYVKVCDAKF